MPSPGVPEPELRIDERLVADLLRAQHPDLADLPIHERHSGCDNVTYRLGDDLAVRLPRRSVAVELTIKEQTWLPSLARQLPVAVPVPLRVGVPGEEFPWPWSVVLWISGTTADLEPLGVAEGARVADFLAALHTIASPGAPTNPFRGGPLRDRAGDVEGRLARLSDRTDLVTPELLRAWRRAVAAPTDRARRWLHGDLHPSNLIVRGGILTGVIDWGDLAAGDVATDLAAVWMLFEDRHARSACLASYGAPEALVVRAMGWAIFFGSAFGALPTPAGDAAAAPGRPPDKVAAAALRRLAEDL
ncbi:aminoglycoside phosphotransferase family protein [Candidatus Palauibacter sp.]|uniref:aminoglycoside phosphotransferase family protein n=1 Tax=Candidatus Palauibacter sp. TaxID=3101350 RepID=UPI003B02776C